MSDVVIIGGGVVGLSLAYELSGRGVQVTVLERGALGREASWAGAGILPPGNPDKARHPLDQLRGHSARLILQWTEQLREQTGVDNGYLRCGGLELALVPCDEPALHQAAQAWQTEGIRAEEARGDALRALEPALDHDIPLAYRLPDLAQLRNPRHLKALAAACARQGVRLRTGKLVTGLVTQESRVRGVRLLDDIVHGDNYVVAAGAWSAGLLDRVGVRIQVKPIRGQIVLLALPAPPFRHVLLEGSCYLVPRPDGRVLVGSTEDDAGFDARPTPQGVHGLLEFAFRLVPSLRDAHFERAWAGLRPGSADGLPYLGRAPEHDNLYMATGHFRAGLQLSAGTALVMAQLILGQPTNVPLDAFRPGRNQ